MKQFNLIVCGGTFDHFHKGHESFLKYVFSIGKKSIVGITSDEFVRRWKVDDRSWKQIEPFGKRREAVLEFIKKEGVLDKSETVKIDNLFGPTLSRNLKIDAIVVSEDTEKGAEIVNRERKKLDLVPLKVFVFSSVKAEDGGLISSARIRSGTISRTGKLYIKPLWLKRNLFLPQYLRRSLQRPFGELLTDIESLFVDKNYPVITVGDVTTKIFNEKFLGQSISVVDFKVNREKKFENIKELGFTGSENIFYADNDAGYISVNLFKKLSKIFRLKTKSKIILQVTGEEDLAVLPLILAAPLNTIIYYGQPPLRSPSLGGQAGVIRVVVTEQSKERAYNIVSKFEPI